MHIRLNDKWSDALCAFPESGMGYQRVDIRLRDGQQVKQVLVFNAEVMEWPDDLQRIRVDDIAGMAPSDL